MPALKPGPPERELQKLIELYLRAETRIINEIVRLRSQGLVDYHAVAALERVQAILRKLESDCWEYVPRMIETQFYVRRPEARKPLEEPETPEKHLMAYRNARTLTAEQTGIVQRLTANLMGQVTEAAATALAGLQSALIGRTEPDVFRRAGLEQTALRAAMGRGTYKALPDFVEALRREGVTAFVDKAGRRWSLHSYCAMASRTTFQQAGTLSLLTADPEQDLYKISAHGTTCRLCAPYEGRVYSRSGTDPDFPPLAAAFGKVDPNGPDDLSNTWLNIHPNCLHRLTAWTPAGRTAEEIQKIKDFSNPRKNPFSRDPRTEKQREAYRRKEAGRRWWLEDRRQWERYRGAGIGPKTFETFQKHKYGVLDPETKKRCGDEKFKAWKLEYRRRGAGWQGAGGGVPPKPGEPVQIGTVDFSDKKAVLAQLGAAQREFRDLPYEVNCTVTADGKVWRVSGDSGSVNPSAIPSSLAGSYSYHNHPRGKTYFSFSAADAAFFITSGEAYSKASDHLFEYIMRRTPNTIALSADMVYHRFKEIENTLVLKMKWDQMIDPDLDGYHETMRILSQELKFDYERKEGK